MSNPAVYCVECGKFIEKRDLDEALVLRIWEVCLECVKEDAIQG